MIVLLVFLLLGKVEGQFHPLRLSEGKKMTPEAFRRIPDEPFSDPADDIPDVNPAQVESFSRTGELPPRDQYQREGNTMSKTESKKRAHMWINYEQLHDRLIQEQARPDATTHTPLRARSNPNRNNYKTYAQFEPGSFKLRDENMFGNSFNLSSIKPIVWTTCDEFKSGGHAFNPEEIVNIEWLPFFIWSVEIVIMTFIHTFQIPTQKQVFEFHSEYGPYLNRSVDWNQPKLYMVEDQGFREALLIAADRTGLYHMIMKVELPEFVQRNKIQIPQTIVRLKVVGDYLAMMVCGENIAMIMARSSQVPPTNKDKTMASKVLGFKGKGRPVTRNLKYEEQRMQLEKQNEQYLEDMKYLPSDPDAGLDRKPANDRPIGRKRKNRIKNRDELYADPDVIPDRIVM